MYIFFASEKYIADKYKLCLSFSWYTKKSMNSLRIERFIVVAHLLLMCHPSRIAIRSIRKLSKTEQGPCWTRQSIDINITQATRQTGACMTLSVFASLHHYNEQLHASIDTEAEILIEIYFYF